MICVVKKECTEFVAEGNTIIPVYEKYTNIQKTAITELLNLMKGVDN